jgi:nuclear pore complex protein Nup155
MQAFSVRMSCYRHVMEMLRRLWDAGTAHPLSSNVPRTPGPPPPRDPTQLSPADAASSAEAVLDLCLRSDDELFHVALYQWLVEQDRCERLLAVRSPFVEEFLVKGTKKHPEALVLFDLLWKYYEKTHSYAAAAKILSKLADRHRWAFLASS